MITFRVFFLLIFVLLTPAFTDKCSYITLHSTTVLYNSHAYLVPLFRKVLTDCLSGLNRLIGNRGWGFIVVSHGLQANATVIPHRWPISHTSVSLCFPPVPHRISTRLYVTFTVVKTLLNTQEPPQTLRMATRLLLPADMMQHSTSFLNSRYLTRKYMKPSLELSIFSER